MAAAAESAGEISVAWVMRRVAAAGSPGPGRRRSVIDLGRDGDVWILRMEEGENRFNRRWLDAVNAALDRSRRLGARPRW
jgi:hypothetical protein